MSGPDPTKPRATVYEEHATEVAREKFRKYANQVHEELVYSDGLEHDVYIVLAPL